MVLVKIFNERVHEEIIKKKHSSMERTRMLMSFVWQKHTDIRLRAYGDK